MILEMAVADAYCIAFEFVERDKYPGVNDLSGYYQHPEYAGLKPSQYTDDTLRTIATANVILDHPRIWSTPHEYLASLQQVFREDPRDGFSRRFQKFLEENPNTKTSAVDLQRKIDRKHSNGSLMGCLPCGFLEDPKDVMLAAMMQAISTHSHKTVPYAQVLALAAHHLMRGEDRETIPDFIEHWMDHTVIDAEIYKPVMANPERCGMGARSTTKAVFRILYQLDSLSEMIFETVEAGGDTDSVAALAVGLGSLTKEVKNDLPQVLVEGLEFGDLKVRDRLLMLEAMLRKMHLKEEWHGEWLRK